MDAQALVIQLIKSHRWDLAMMARDKDYGDPYDGGVWSVVMEAVELAYGFTGAEARKFLIMVTGEEY